MMESDLNTKDAERIVNVSRRFEVALVIFFVYWMVQIFRSLMILISLSDSIFVHPLLHTILAANEGLGISAAVVLHYYRFSYAGRACACKDAGKFFDYEACDKQPDQFLVKRGQMLVALAIVYWVFSLFNVLFHSVFCKKKVHVSE
jgi:hypothetical protein